jgi:hypothetical protein
MNAAAHHRHPFPYDPVGWLGTGPHPVLVLVEGGRGNVVTISTLTPALPVVGIPALAVGYPLARRVAAATVEHGSTVYLWAPDGLEAAVDTTARRLLRAGIQDVLLIPERTAPEDHLRPLGRERAARRFEALLEHAELDGPYNPDNPYESRRRGVRFTPPLPPNSTLPWSGSRFPVGVAA